MKVKLRTVDETSGWLKKTTKYALYVAVELSPEERDAIKRAGIEGYVLLEYSYKGLELNYQVKSALHSSDKATERKFVGADAIERNKIQDSIKDGLAWLKSQIEAHAASSNREEEFEL